MHPAGRGETMVPNHDHDSKSGSQLPLSGITVIECASIVAGPLAAQFLGDMGAEVIKIEPPAGDLTRAIGPRKSEGMGSFFLNNNRNKKSVVLDLKVKEGLEVLKRMVGQSDVFLHSIRTSAADRLGLSYEDLRSINEAIVYCHVKGFSDKGSYAGKPAYDDIIQSLSGLAMLQEVVGGEPRYMPAIFADKTAAIHAAYATVLALFHRERTGEGQKVDVSMFETMVSFNMAEHLWGMTFEPPLGPMGYEPVSTAARRPFRTVDGYVSFLPYSDEQWRRFFELINRLDIVEDPRFATFSGRQQNVKMVWSEIAHQLTLRTNAEWVQLLESEDIPFAVLNSLEDLLTDPHLVETEFWQVAEHETEGLLRFPGAPFDMSRTPQRLDLLPPGLGRHTQDVLQRFGYSEQEIAGLIEQGATTLTP
jgi:crotonobetainyl-CoA:carnitine CoA-transferase CaiB-like acyl-CoA transferase